MKKTTICTLTLLSLCGHVLAQQGVTPGYDLEDSIRSPFVFVDKNKDANQKEADQESAKTATSRVSNELRLLGAMQGANNTQIGLFNKGVVKVGEILSTVIDSKQVQMRLIRINTVTMQATFRLGENEFTVGKGGGTK